MANKSKSIVPRSPDLGLKVPRVAVDTTAAGAAHLRAWAGDQQLAALHESAHVVVGAVLGIALKSVDIKSRLGGRAEFGFADDTQPAYRTASRIRAEIAMALGGLVAEFHLLGEGTSGAHDDIRRATDTARELVDGGLDPRAPWYSIRAFSHREERIPDGVLDAYHEVVAAIVTEQRLRAEALVVQYADAIVGLATRIYERRRLSDGELADALRAVGIEPTVPGGDAE